MNPEDKGQPERVAPLLETLRLKVDSASANPVTQ